MCGISGALFFRDSDGADPRTVVWKMTDAMSHRGPDGRGVALCGAPDGAPSAVRVALSHNRLAILDLSDRAAQPMKSERAPIWITFNGEIYNFADIRGELETRGRHFRTTSDSEVILQGYEEWGESVLERLRGMFALAVWDGRIGQLLLARDRVGIKPIYWYWESGRLFFASEVRALLATDLVPRKLDRIAVDQYLTYQTVPPPRTLIDGVRMMAPGSLLRIDSEGEVTERRYWNQLDNASPGVRGDSHATARRRVGELLAESAALHLVSDVPVGIFLSGGIDSSALVALTRQAGAVPRTFSITLPGSAHDEARFARQVARRFDADHVEIPLTDTDFRDQLPEATTRVDHPSGDGLNTFVVSRAVRQAGFKVALSGLGGDEVFGGYPSFQRMRRLASYAPAWRHSPGVVRAAAAAAVRALGRDSIGSAKTAAVLETDASVPQAFPILRQLFSASDRAALLGPDAVSEKDPYVALLEAAVERHPDVELMSLVSYAEARTYMHDVLLRDTDQMSMAHGLEARVPLLDHRLIEYVMGLSDEVKAAGDVPKRLLVESLGDALPAECVNRPKQGFVLPFDAWMKAELRPFCERHLGSAGIGGLELFQPQAVAALWQAFLAGDRRTSWSRPWALVALAAWSDQNGLKI